MCQEMHQRHSKYLKRYTQHPQFHSGELVQRASHLEDGSPVHGGSESHTDGFVKLPTGQISVAHQVTLPDSTNLVVEPMGAPKPTAKRPDGFKLVMR